MFRSECLSCVEYIQCTHQTECCVCGRSSPGSQVRVTDVVEECARRLYGGLGAVFSSTSSVSAEMVAAPLLATHWYRPRSSSTMSAMVRLPPSIVILERGSGVPSFCNH